MEHLIAALVITLGISWVFLFILCLSLNDAYQCFIRIQQEIINTLLKQREQEIMKHFEERILKSAQDHAKLSWLIKKKVEDGTLGNLNQTKGASESAST